MRDENVIIACGVSAIAGTLLVMLIAWGTGAEMYRDEYLDALCESTFPNTEHVSCKVSGG